MQRSQRCSVFVGHSRNLTSHLWFVVVSSEITGIAKKFRCAESVAVTGCKTPLSAGLFAIVAIDVAAAQCGLFSVLSLYYEDAFKAQ